MASAWMRTAEPVEQHEVPAGAAKQSWFGVEDDVAATMEGLSFSSEDVEGVIAALQTNELPPGSWKRFPST